MPARRLYGGILDQRGEIVRHRHMQAAPETLLNVMAPDREGLVGAVECLVTWSWLADLCAEAGLPFGLGQALSMHASHGGQATHDTLEAHKMAALLRGELLPPASGSPAQRRAPRDLWRRRMPLTHQRADLLAHVQQTTSQDHLPAMGQNSADAATRAGGAERVAEPAVHKSLEVDLALITADEAWRRAVDLTLLTTARPHDATRRDRLHTGPGLGKRLRRVWLDAIPASHRCPRVPDGLPSGRLGQGRQASAGQRLGTSGATRGQAPLPWACSEAAVWCLSDPPAARQDLARPERHHDQGNAFPILAHKWARAVS